MYDLSGTTALVTGVAPSSRADSTFLSSLRTAKKVIAYQPDRERGLTDAARERGCVLGQANYGAAKAGIAAFSTIVAFELARYSITSNAICPAARTRMTAGPSGAP